MNVLKILMYPKKISSGSFGEVYYIDEETVVKISKSPSNSFFITPIAEINYMAILKHKNIVKIEDLRHEKELNYDRVSETSTQSPSFLIKSIRASTPSVSGTFFLTTSFSL